MKRKNEIGYKLILDWDLKILLQDIRKWYRAIQHQIHFSKKNKEYIHRRALIEILLKDIYISKKVKIYNK